MTQAKDLRDQSVVELEAELLDKAKELFGVRNQRRTSGSMEKPHLPKKIRRDVARIKTILREKAEAEKATAEEVS